MEVKSYKELIAYQRSYELVKVIYNISKKFPREETYGMVSQMRRAAVSIPSNIAEGYMRGSKEYVHFLKIALGSCAELETQLSLSGDMALCDKNELQKAHELNTEAMKLLTTYINKLSGRIVNTPTKTLIAKR